MLTTFYKIAVDLIVHVVVQIQHKEGDITEVEAATQKVQTQKLI